MYIPPAFEGPDRAQLFDFVAAHSFGLLVSQRAGEPFATHLPLVARAAAGAQGKLLGHMARANPQWRDLADQEVLAVFTGPHAYISPRWYEANQVVPTWNYVAVHVYGRCQVIDDPSETMQILVDYVTTYEGSGPGAWSVDPGDDFLQKLAKQIVAFRIEITRVEGKWKLSQNHSPERRAKVERQLAASDDPQEQAIARLMAALESK